MLRINCKFIEIYCAMIVNTEEITSLRLDKLILFTSRAAFFKL